MTKTKIFSLLKLDEIIGLDLRSLAIFRIGLALMTLTDIIIRAQALNAHYTDSGILPRSALIDMLNPWYWSINLISGHPFIQGLIFAVAIFFALAMLFGYRTRLATIATWALIISLNNRNPALIFAADHVLRAMLFWSMFLPLGACYSIDSALNSSSNSLPKKVCSGATLAFLIQVCYIYIWSAAFKTKSDIWWPDGDAVYYSLSFDQYSTAFGQFLLTFPQEILKLLTISALIFEWVGPLIIFIPFRNALFRCIAIVSFVLLHIGFELCFHIGILSYLSICMWLALIPSVIWDKAEQKIENKQRQGLTIYYDADCGFCKKVVYLLRTFLILPKTPVLMAQDYPSIYEDMLAENSWVVEDWQQNRYFKWEGIIYVVSLSPLFSFLAPILKWQPLKSLGTKIYETIASNRKFAGKFTAPLKFRPIEVCPSLIFNFITVTLLLLTTMWNLRSFVKQTYAWRQEQKNDWITATHKLLNRRTLQYIHPIGYMTRLDQTWSIFAPAPPRDDGWHVIEGKLKDGSTVNVLAEEQPITWDKPNIKQRQEFYQTIQWRVYLITLNRAIGKKLYPHYAAYLCRQWNSTHQGKKQLDGLIIYYMDERTVPPNEIQTVEKTVHYEKSCSDKGE
ncbi:MAG: HTTM domain-containing protein [Okeania sp. SIO3H1]|nr:HTTM domain-containing protein [Okeania sp. SIO3H1]